MELGEDAKSLVADYRGKLLVYTLDSTIRLEQWDLISGLVKELSKHQNHQGSFPSSSGNVVECGVDLLLSSSACPNDVLLGALQIIIKEGVYSVKSSLETATKWVRILMSLALPSRDQICDEAMTHLKEGLALRNVRCVGWLCIYTLLVWLMRFIDYGVPST